MNIEELKQNMKVLPKYPRLYLSYRVEYVKECAKYLTMNK